MKLIEKPHHFLWVAFFGKARKAHDVGKQNDTFAPFADPDRFIAIGKLIGKGGGEIARQIAMGAFSCGKLVDQNTQSRNHHRTGQRKDDDDNDLFGQCRDIDEFRQVIGIDQFLLGRVPFIAEMLRYNHARTGDKPPDRPAPGNKQPEPEP